MSYEQGALGFQTFRGDMSASACIGSRPVTVCFPPGQRSMATGGGCRELADSGCRYTTSAGAEQSGTTWCCPSDWRSSSEPAETPGGGTTGGKEAEEGWEEQFTFPAELIGQKVEEAIESVSNAARRVVNAVVGQETSEDVAALVPGAESLGPGAAAQTFLQRYQTPLIVGSLVVGVGALVWYFLRRPRRVLA